MSVFGELFEQENMSDKIYGVVTGIVKENWNKDYPGKVKVLMDLGVQGKNLTGWIPVMTPYAGNAYGMYTHPEVGAQVVVSFQLGDPNCPIVIGSLYNNVNVLPSETAVEKNTVKKILTKSGSEICFSGDEKKDKITIQTPKKLTISLEDEDQKITVSDSKNENGIIVDEKNGTVVIMAKKKMELKVNGNSMVSLDGTKKEVGIKGNMIKVEGSQTMSLKGQSFKAEGASVSVKADATLKMEGGAVAQLKGAMVKIN